jgi:hypothetical protein
MCESMRQVHFTMKKTKHHQLVDLPTQISNVVTLGSEEQRREAASSSSQSPVPLLAANSSPGLLPGVDVGSKRKRGSKACNTALNAHADLCPPVVNAGRLSNRKKYKGTT